MSKEFLERAIDPNQYDSPELHWDQEGFLDSPTRVFLWNNISPVLGDLSEQTVLDVGTGTAWLPYRMQGELGAENVTALEPSETQRQLAHKFNPNQRIKPVDLFEFHTDQAFDVVTAVMVFEHIYDLDGAFARLEGLTRVGSRVMIVMADKANFLRPRTDYEIEQQQVDEDTVAIRALRAYGTLYDIVRPVDTLTQAAEHNNFSLVLHQPLTPDEELRTQVSRYNENLDQPICHLMVFERQ